MSASSVQVQDAHPTVTTSPCVESVFKSSAIKGVGPSLANALITMFGDRAIDVLLDGTQEVQAVTSEAVEYGAMASGAVETRAVGSDVVESKAVGSEIVGSEVVGSEVVGSEVVGSEASLVPPPVESALRWPHRPASDLPTLDPMRRPTSNLQLSHWFASAAGAAECTWDWTQETADHSEIGSRVEGEESDSGVRSLSWTDRAAGGVAVVGDVAVVGNTTH